MCAAQQSELLFGCNHIFATIFRTTTNMRDAENGWGRSKVDQPARRVDADQKQIPATEFHQNSDRGSFRDHPPPQFLVCGDFLSKNSLDDAELAPMGKTNAGTGDVHPAHWKGHMVFHEIRNHAPMGRWRRMCTSRGTTIERLHEFLVRVFLYEFQLLPNPVYVLLFLHRFVVWEGLHRRGHLPKDGLGVAPSASFVHVFWTIVRQLECHLSLQLRFGNAARSNHDALLLWWVIPRRKASAIC